MYMVSFLTSVRKLIFSHMSDWAEFKDVIAIFLKMMKALDHSNCPEKHLWRRYHADLLKMESQKIFMDFGVKYTDIGTVR